MACLDLNYVNIKSALGDRLFAIRSELSDVPTIHVMDRDEAVALFGESPVRIAEAAEEYFRLYAD